VSLHNPSDTVTGGTKVSRAGQGEVELYLMGVLRIAFKDDEMGGPSDKIEGKKYIGMIEKRK